MLGVGLAQAAEGRKRSLRSLEKRCVLGTRRGLLPVSPRGLLPGPPHTHTHSPAWGRPWLWCWSSTARTELQWLLRQTRCWVTGGCLLRGGRAMPGRSHVAHASPTPARAHTPHRPRAHCSPASGPFVRHSVGSCATQGQGSGQPLRDAHNSLRAGETGDEPRNWRPGPASRMQPGCPHTEPRPPGQPPPCRPRTQDVRCRGGTSAARFSNRRSVPARFVGNGVGKRSGYSGPWRELVNA